MVRLVFRPYTQVRRTICTSVSLRASTRVSSGFAPLRHSSPSFGSRQTCSHSNPSHKIGADPTRFPPTISSTLDSLFKVLFIFPSHGTCSLSASRQYLALDRTYRRLGCIPKQPDSATAPRVAAGVGPYGALTLPGAPFPGDLARSVAEVASSDYNSG
ncbi:hypothetical protein AXF42_Ash021350 [Apostasia shenzhenica]|uniref:Uncharacterized protein n=1 Tax=Apostasia shenzhenica TaxID=1088818 RepID=A0A2H9ZSN9_9ASPA|nr:hypothetical protein AXF42_Ash021350 [Apostasia shenzhenica]